MIILTSADTLQLVLGANPTTNPSVYASWADSTTTPTFQEGRNLSDGNGTTPVNIVTSPAASTIRAVKTIFVKNKDTGTISVTIRFSDGGGTYDFLTVPLNLGESLEYDDGWRVRTAAGGIKSSDVFSTPTINELTTVVLGSDVVNNNATANTIADVTGLEFPVVAGETYWYEFVIPYTSAATATGSRWAINGPSAPTLLNHRSEYTLTATSVTTNCATAYDVPATSNASSLTNGNVATMWGIIKPSASGTVIARFASEISASAITAKAGATLRYQRVA